MEIFKIIKVHPEDSVAVAVQNLQAGEEVTIDTQKITLKTDIDSGHKFAIKPIAKDEPVIKYGAPIGAAKLDIEVGSHVHANNIRTLLSESAEYHYDKDLAQQVMQKAEKKKQEWQNKVPTIKAYKRSNGKIGIRNELWIVPTVGCVNMISNALVAWANENLKKTPSYDGIHVWAHPYGCSQLGDDHEATRTILADLVHHPNAGGVLVLSLGCETTPPIRSRNW